MSSTVRTALENGSPTGITLCVGGTFRSRLRSSASGSTARVEGSHGGLGAGVASWEECSGKPRGPLRPGRAWVRRRTLEESGRPRWGSGEGDERQGHCFHSHGAGAGAGPTPAVPGRPREGAGEGAAAEETRPRGRRGARHPHGGEGSAGAACAGGGRGRSLAPRDARWGRLLPWLRLLASGCSKVVVPG